MPSSSEHDQSLGPSTLHRAPAAVRLSMACITCSHGLHMHSAPDSLLSCMRTPDLPPCMTAALHITSGCCAQVMHHQGFYALSPAMAAIAWLGVLLAVGGLGLLYCTTVSDPGFIPQGASAPARAGHRSTEGRKSTPTGGSGSSAPRFLVLCAVASVLCVQGSVVCLAR